MESSNKYEYSISSVFEYFISLKKIFLNNDNSTLNDNFIKQMLQLTVCTQKEEDLLRKQILLESELNHIKNYNENHIFEGYFKTDCLLVLANNLNLFFVKQVFPYKFASLDVFFDEETNKEIESLNNKMLIILNTKFENLSDKLQFTITLIQERGILTLLGIRKTNGSENNFSPPHITELIKQFELVNYDEISFNEKLSKNKHLKPPILTVGGRALCKHSHRCSNKFWPIANGSDEKKNNEAKKILNIFFTKCIWINIHGLPHNNAIIELRLSEGYGVRWLIGGDFRGFVEPPLKDGHEKGWKH